MIQGLPAKGIEGSLRQVIGAFPGQFHLGANEGRTAGFGKLPARDSFGLVGLVGWHLFGRQRAGGRVAVLILGEQDKPQRIGVQAQADGDPALGAAALDLAQEGVVVVAVDLESGTDAGNLFWGDLDPALGEMRGIDDGAPQPALGIEPAQSVAASQGDGRVQKEAAALYGCYRADVLADHFG